MFWIIIWMVMLVLFVLVPILCQEHRRRAFSRRIKQCFSRRQVEPEGRENTNEEYRCVLSKAQEDEIRESFLMEKLNMYSMVLSPLHTRQPTMSTETDDTEDSSEKAHTSRQNSDDDDDDDIDVEAPKSSAAEQGTDDCTNTDGGTSDGQDEPKGDEILVDEFMGDITCRITVPLPGECRQDLLPNGINGHTRDVPNGCAICLCEFDTDDRVCWSGNPDCPHVFHHSCTLDWLKASGRKFLKRQRRQEQRSGVVSSPNDPIAQITNFPMLCPCCRQDFVSPDEEDSDSEKPSQTNDNGTSSSPTDETQRIDPADFRVTQVVGVENV